MKTLSTFVFLLLLGLVLGNDSNIISGTFTATNSLRAQNYAVWDPATNRWQRFYQSVDFPDTVHSESFGSASNNADRIAFIAADGRGVTFFDGTQWINHLGQYSSSGFSDLSGVNIGAFVDGGLFELVNSRNFNIKSAPVIERVVVSGNVVFACGTFNKIGPNLFNNQTAACTNTCPFRTPQQIAAFTLGNSFNDVRNFGWQFVWPTLGGFNSNGFPTGGATVGPQGDVLSTTTPFSCSTMMPVGTNGRILIQSTEQGRDNFWTYQVQGSTVTASQFSLNHNLVGNVANFRGSVKTQGETVYVWGRNFNGVSTETLPYILSKSITTSGAASWAPVVAPNSTWSVAFTDWLVGTDGKFYFTVAKCTNIGIRPQDCVPTDRFRQRYVWQYTGNPGTTETPFLASPLGNKQLTLTSSPSSCQNYQFQDIANGDHQSVNLWWDRRLGKLIVWNNNLGWVMNSGGNGIPDCETQLMQQEPFLHQQNRYHYYSTKLNGIAQWDGQTWAPVYGGASMQISGIAQDPTSGRTYFWNNAGNFDWVYNSYTPYISSYNSDSRLWQFPVTPRVNFNGYPALGTTPSVRYAEWINNDDLVVAGNFRSIDGVKVNSIAILHNQKAPDTLPPNSCPFPGKSVQCSRVGVRSTVPSGDFLAALRTPGTIREVVSSNDFLYVAGDFDFCGNVPCSKLARYNRRTNTWEDLKTGWAGSQYVYAITFYDGKFWVAGNFKQVNNVLVSNVAYMSEPSAGNFVWESPNAGIPGNDAYNIVRLLPYDGSLVAVGNFQTASGEFSSYISRWVGNRWTFVNSRNLTSICPSQDIHNVETCAPQGQVYDAYILGGRLYLLLQNSGVTTLWSWQSENGFRYISTWNINWAGPGAHQLGRSSNSNSNDNLYVFSPQTPSSYGVDTNNLVEFNSDRANFVQTPGQAGTNGNVWFTKRNWGVSQ